MSERQPSPHFPFESAEARERFGRRMVEFGAEVQQIADTMARAFRPVAEQSVRALQPLIEFANSPQGQALIAAHEARTKAGLYDAEACHCLCQHNHPGRTTCLGEMPPRDVRTVHYRTPELGPVDVPMCPPCAEATLIEVTS